MLDTHLLLWIVIFAIFFFVGVCERSRIFGTIAGFWLMLLGLFTIMDGIQTEVGVTITQVNDTTLNIVYSNADLVLPFSTYAIVWGLILILVSIYIVYANLLS
jgi:hypothetical protein